MENFNLTEVIDQTFEGMIKKKLVSFTVHTFGDIKQITLPSGLLLDAKFAKIILLRLNSNNVIKLVYNDNDTSKILSFANPQQKEITLKCLRDNDILPVPEKFLEAKSLVLALCQPLRENMFHGVFWLIVLSLFILNWSVSGSVFFIWLLFCISVISVVSLSSSLDAYFWDHWLVFFCSP